MLNEYVLGGLLILSLREYRGIEVLNEHVLGGWMKY